MEERTYKVLVLGASGSGKTVFLASMFEKLSIQHRRIGFYLQTPERERIILTNKYSEIADPGRPFPAGTRRHEISEWTFNTVVQHNGRDYPVLRFVYWDYAGEILTDIGEDTQTTIEISTLAAQADSLLVLLDGQKIFYMLEGKEDSPLLPLDHDLSHLLPIVQPAGLKPIHFVVTKWDILAGKYTLEQVRAALLADEKLQAIIEQRRTLKAPTRLIPVSSVGNAFARLNAKGHMVKVGTGRPRPYQVEMPLACTFIDGFQSAYQQALQEQEKFSFRLKLILWNLLRLLGLAGEASLQLLPLPAQWRIGATLVGVLLNYLERGLVKSVERLETERLSAVEQIKDRQTAMKSVVLSYELLMRQLEMAYPASDFYRVSTGDGGSYVPASMAVSGKS